MTFALLGIGTAIPATVYDQAEGLAMAKSLCCRTDEQVTWLPTMYQGTGIRKRHMVLPRALVDDVIAGTSASGSVYLPSGEPEDRGPTTAQRMQVYGEEAGRLACAATAKALRQGGVAAAELTHLVTVSCTGFHAPGFDQEMIHALRLPLDLHRTHIGFMGCHGALNGLRVARAFAEADPDARVLLCAVELCSLHYHYGWDPGKVVANAIFADGAAAVVGSALPKPATSHWRLIASGSRIIPGTADAMSWTIGDHGFEMTLSKQVPGLIHKHLRPWLVEWLARQERRLEDIRSWAIHPGGPRILGAAEEALALSPDQTATARTVFAEYGNMSSPTALFILDRLRQQQAPRPCLALGFGPGLAVEAALFE
jgi:predicted naringenin-chalcone synthase